MSDDDDETHLQRNVRQSLGHGRRVLCPHAHRHRSGAGKCADWCNHDTWNQKSKIHFNKPSGTLLAEQRLLVSQAFLAWPRQAPAVTREAEEDWSR
jgi:hypothetical protein